MGAPLVLLAALAAVALVGCRHAADEPAATEPPETTEPVGEARGPLAEAARRTKEAGTARLGVEVSLTSQGVVSAVGGEGALDGESRRSRVLLSIGAATGDDEPGPEGDGVETVIDGATAYARSALLDQFLLEQAAAGAPGTWVRRELGPASREQGVDLGALLYWGGGSPDPVATLDYLLATGDDVDELGTEQVRGATTTRYRATVDLREVPDAVAAEDRDAVRSSIEALVDPGEAGEIPVEAWIDDEGLVRRLHVVYEDVPGSDGGEASIEHTLEFFDLGADVEIRPPAAENVIEMEDLTGQGGAP